MLLKSNKTVLSDNNYYDDNVNSFSDGDSDSDRDSDCDGDSDSDCNGDDGGDRVMVVEMVIVIIVKRMRWSFLTTFAGTWKTLSEFNFNETYNNQICIVIYESGYR